jgi:hypothetical protein
LERSLPIYGKSNKSIVKEEDEFSLQQWEPLTKPLLRLSKVFNFNQFLHRQCLASIESFEKCVYQLRLTLKVEWMTFVNS